MMIRDWLQTWRIEAARNREVNFDALGKHACGRLGVFDAFRFAEHERRGGATSRTLAQRVFLRRSGLGARTRLS